MRSRNEEIGEMEEIEEIEEIEGIVVGENIAPYASFADTVRAKKSI